MNRSIFYIAVLAAFAMSVPASNAFAGSRSKIDWTGDADGTQVQLKTHGCIKVEGYIYADGANIDLDLESIGCSEVIVLPGADCEHPRKVRRVIHGRVRIIVSCN